MSRVGRRLPRTLLAVLLCGVLAVTAGCSGDTSADSPLCSVPEADGPPLDPTTTHLLVVNSLGEDWMSFTLTGAGLVPREDRGLAGRAPNDLDIAGGELLFLNSGDNTLQIVDTLTGKTTGCIDLGVGSSPFELAVAPDDSSRAWISMFLSGELVEVDLPTRRVLRRLEVGPGIEGVLVTPAHVAATLTGFEGTEGSFGRGEVVVFERASLAEVARLAVPTNPQSLLFGPDGRIHVICTGNYGAAAVPRWGRVVRIESDWSAVRDTLELGGTPSRAAVAPSGRVYVSAFFGGVMVYDGLTFTPLHDSGNPVWAGEGFTGVTVHGNRVYVLDFDDDAVAVLDAATGTLVDGRLTGDGPSALAVVPPSLP